MLSGYSFRPQLWAAILAAAACAAGIALGNWQAGRAAQKRALGEQFEQAMQASPMEIGPEMTQPESVVRRRVAARGQFVDAHTVFLDNKLRHGRPGYEVVTPLRLDGAHVLVNRGWIAASARRDVLPQVAAPAGPVRVEGIALARLPHALAAGEPRGKVRQNVDVRDFERETGLRLLPFVIEQHSAAPDGLAREWPRPDTGSDMHASYALQWYSLAGLSILLFLVLSLRRVGQN